MKDWYRIEFFSKGFLYCVPSAEIDHRVFMCERQYTSISRAWGAAKRMASVRSDVYFIKVRCIDGDFECHYAFR